MGNQLLASKIVVMEEQPRVRVASSTSTSILGAVGVTERGPIGVPTLVTSWEDYVRVFGGFISTNPELPLAMFSFFQNGGSLAYVTRVVHYGAGGATTAKVASVTLDDSLTADALEISARYGGTYGNSLKVRVSAASSGETAEYNLTILRNGVAVEVFPNVSSAAAHERYVEAVLANESNLVDANVVTDGLRPENTATDQALTGGDDGLTGLTDADFIGSSADGTGLYSLDTIQDIGLLIVPGVTDGASQRSIVNYCEQHRGGTMFAILDPKAGRTATQVKDDFAGGSAPLSGYSEYFAFYWPRYKIMNPAATVFSGRTVTVPPSGGVAGVYARKDASGEGGVYGAPAGVDDGRLLDAVALETDEVLKEPIRDLLYPKQINPICYYTGTSIHIDGSKTGKRNGNFPSVPERRGVIKISKDLVQILLPFKHKPHTAQLRSAIDRSIRKYLTDQMKVGAFASYDPSRAFFVIVDESINTPSVVASNKVLIRVGLATAKPAEFIVLQLSQDTRALEAELG